MPPPRNAMRLRGSTLPALLWMILLVSELYTTVYALPTLAGSVQEGVSNSAKDASQSLKSHPPGSGNPGSDSASVALSSFGTPGAAGEASSESASDFRAVDLAKQQQPQKGSRLPIDAPHTKSFLAQGVPSPKRGQEVCLPAMQCGYHVESKEPTQLFARVSTHFLVAQP
jgi:hypothetical protein